MRMERKYFAISIKHTEHKWKFGKPCVLWGYKRTPDEEKRCFAGYTENPSKAELYAEDDFIKHGYGMDIVKPTPVEMSVDLCKKWCMYDTVLIEADQYIGYCKMACIPTGSEQGA